MTTRKTLSVVVFLVSVWALSSHVYAHESKETQDGTIVFVHINPYDNPVTYMRNTMFVLITANRHQFPIESCDCTTEITDEKNTFMSSSTIAGKQGNAIVPYYFERPGVYHLIVRGAPQGEATFKPFSLSFDIPVERGSFWEYFHDRRVLYAMVAILLALAYTVKHYVLKK